MGVTPRYRLVAGDPPDDAVGAVDWHGPDECMESADDPAGGSPEARDGDAMCTRPRGHDGPHWDPWECSAWELVR